MSNELENSIDLLLNNSKSIEKESINQQLLLIKFSTDWCVPCHKLRETISKLLEKEVNLLVLEINVEKLPFLAELFGISTVPTTFLFFQGRIIKGPQVGNMNPLQLKNFIKINK
jgi:thioredoxin 1